MRHSDGGLGRCPYVEHRFLVFQVLIVAVGQYSTRIGLPRQVIASTSELLFSLYSLYAVFFDALR